MLTRIVVCAVALLSVGLAVGAETPEGDGKLRIIVFGAHPDDAELGAGGVAIKWAAQGHHVKLVAVTNGDIGHWEMAGGPLAQRRRQEVLEAGKILGVTNEILDIHDGELLPTLENRRILTRLIRKWNADIVITHRPNDYHPDHRYTSILVQDSAYMVTVPFFCPDTPHLTKNPVYLYSPDPFQKPTPFAADVAVDIDDVADSLLDALMRMESQFYEGGANGYAGIVPEDADGQVRRRTEVRAWLASLFQRAAGLSRDALAEYYGEERAKTVKHANAFEVCEYGRQPSREELKRLFPFFPGQE